MSPDEPVQLPVATNMALLRRRKLEATQALLGDTIAIPDQAWQEPSLLPGWTRAHVATHLARNADGLRRVVEGLLTGHPQHMYASPQERDEQLELGSRRGALDLQIDLDTSAGQLNQALNQLEVEPIAWRGEVELSAGRHVPLTGLPLARLAEVVLHHIDLDCGFGPGDVEPDIARWLLEWACANIADRADFPAMELQGDSGHRARLGRDDQQPVLVQGRDADLFCWLTGRGGPEALAGAEGLELPAY